MFLIDFYFSVCQWLIDWNESAIRLFPLGHEG